MQQCKAIRSKPWSSSTSRTISVCHLFMQFQCCHCRKNVNMDQTSSSNQTEPHSTSLGLELVYIATSITVDYSQVIRAGNTPHMTVAKVTVTIKLITMQQTTAAWLQLTIQTLLFILSIARSREYTVTG